MFTVKISFFEDKNNQLQLFLLDCIFAYPFLIVNIIIEQEIIKNNINMINFVIN